MPTMDNTITVTMNSNGRRCDGNQRQRWCTAGIATDCNIEERWQLIAMEKRCNNQLMRDKGQQRWMRQKREGWGR